jgi:hypothetical protein
MPEVKTHIALKEIKHTMKCEGFTVVGENEKEIINLLRNARTVYGVKIPY